jgi:ketosteroid isomerase-like protein
MVPKQALDLDRIKQAMASTNDLFNKEVFGKRNFAALDDIYTADARILPPEAPMISGREAIKKFWSDLITSSDATSAPLDSVEVTPTGDGIVEIGHATIAFKAAPTIDCKYVVFWREESGLWKWHIDIWNRNN